LGHLVYFDIVQIHHGPVESMETVAKLLLKSHSTTGNNTKLETFYMVQIDHGPMETMETVAKLLLRSHSTTGNNTKLDTFYMVQTNHRPTEPVKTMAKTLQRLQTKPGNILKWIQSTIIIRYKAYFKAMEPWFVNRWTVVGMGTS
jgi:hypothetical protein